MSDVFDRAYEVHSTALKAWRPETPFDVPHFGWRVSGDVWVALAQRATELHDSPIEARPPWTARLFGWPIDQDDTLPPNSMLLESAP